MEDADTNFVIESVQQQQIIFHPTIAPAGHIDYTKFFASKRKKPFILALDRNILSSLLKFCEKGSLKNSTEVRLIGLIMTWAEMNGVAISAGMAVRERASQMHSQGVGLVELQRFVRCISWTSVVTDLRRTINRSTTSSVFYETRTKHHRELR